jgi:hypothetical protein
MDSIRYQDASSWWISLLPKIRETDSRVKILTASEFYYEQFRKERGSKILRNLKKTNWDIGFGSSNKGFNKHSQYCNLVALVSIDDGYIDILQIVHMKILSVSDVSNNCWLLQIDSTYCVRLERMG